MLYPSEGWRSRHFIRVCSTNVVAAEIANEGDPGHLWITADEQTNGKARRGRKWISEHGNLYASLLLIDPVPANRLSNLPLVASLALHRTITEFLPNNRQDLQCSLVIKWPNDLLFDGKKLSGLLLEATLDRYHRMAVIIGFGVNCAHSPDNPLYPATSLSEIGCSVNPMVLKKVLARHMASELFLWNKGYGFNLTRKAWLERAFGLGKQVIAKMDDYEVTGRFQTIDDEGFLILKKDDGSSQKISAADIFFGNLNDSKG
ncbi:biotin--[acetyl-CoA-carboxylase] ligase [Candidatus Endowatersipora endosymbiont of Watersipora subatra]|uniref:biotin--[acetyl-CoA-carboxylase] ligase n=1 Tax=Candidatus Endowatersipora endosymbiont of Watersipora subatra TaxID=3077946 RepID=UPI00312C7328